MTCSCCSIMHAHIVMTASKFGHITSVWCYVKLWTSPHHIKHQSRSECTSLVALCTSAHCCYCTHTSLVNRAKPRITNNVANVNSSQWNVSKTFLVLPLWPYIYNIIFTTLSHPKKQQPLIAAWCWIQLVSWSLTSPFSTNMAISQTMMQKPTSRQHYVWDELTCASFSIWRSISTSSRSSRMMRAFGSSFTTAWLTMRLARSA